MPAIAASSIPAKSAARWRFDSCPMRPFKVEPVWGRVWGGCRPIPQVRPQRFSRPTAPEGAVRFDVHQVEGVTRRRHLHESGSLRVRFPSPEAEGLSAVFVNTAGGIAGGDRFDIDIAAGEGIASCGDDGGGGKNLPGAGTGRAAQYRLEGRGGCAPRLAAARDHFVRRGAGVAADRHRSCGKRVAAALRNRGVRPCRDG